MDELENAFKRDVVERTTLPMHTINVEIKYKLSDHWLHATAQHTANTEIRQRIFSQFPYFDFLSLRHLGKVNVLKELLARFILFNWSFMRRSFIVLSDICLYSILRRDRKFLVDRPKDSEQGPGSLSCDRRISTS